ncbi:threonine/serine exporter family protein [Streptomyces sp. cmx-18-6]|uniref:threonine/serine exporter family protein n=1 Tax=Streptomyces sp. cmx-18-6 TaxID=2790930 RepID=UPI00397EE120
MSSDDASTGGRTGGTLVGRPSGGSFLSRRRARREQLARLRDNESTLLDRLYGTEFEGYAFPAPRDVDERTAVASMRFALRHGRELFLAGAQTLAIESAIVAVTARWGMDHMTVDVTSRTIQAQYAPPGARPLTMMMETGSEDSRDLRQLDDLSALTHRVLDEDLSPVAAERELTRIISLKGFWPWWTKVLGGALLAAMLCVLASGTPKAAAVSTVVFLVGNRFGWALSANGLPSFYVTGLQTAAVVGGTMLLADARALTGGEAASVAAANMVLLLPILSVVSLAEDAISGFRAMAAGRLISVGMFLAAMVGGISLVGFLLRDADVDARNTAFRALPLLLSLLTSAVGALGNAVFMGGPPRLLPWAMGAGVLAGLVNGVLHQELHQPTPLAVLGAAAVLGTAAGAVAPALRIPSRSLVVPGIAGALLPGPDVYRSLLQYALHVPGAGGYAVLAFATTAAIGVGTVLGSQIGGAAGRRWAPATRG